jgi:predicted ATPase/DNA-binding winged helix-turn-helix (wHTH) protein
MESGLLAGSLLTSGVAESSCDDPGERLQDLYRFGSFEVRRVERELLARGEPAAIGSRAFDVLLALLEHRDRVVSKNELFDLVWPGLVVEENNLQVQVSSLRKVLGPQAIATIPGRGYRFSLPLDSEAETRDPPRRAQGAAAVDASRTNLPAAVEPPFGRDADMAAVTQLLREHRLVTVLGTGGIGKTRLAQEVARRQLENYPDGVWWVDLAALSSPEQIVPAVAAAAHVRLEAGDSPATLSKPLAARATLLVLDNCEHLAAHVAHLVHAILDAGTEARILATSQEALKSPSEYLYRLESLAVPPAGTTLASARKFGAIQLLEERARAADRHFSLTESGVADAIELTRHLDGIALAIEMAAVRVPVLGLQALNARLGERLKLLRGASRLLPARHQTLRATLDWSHSLLAPEEQAVLRRLSVFVGSFRLELAQAVAAGEDLDEWTTLDALTGLVERSLVQVERSEPPRYRLLETTRLYAAEKCAENGESERCQERHGAALAALGEEISKTFWELPDPQWLALYAADYDDLQAAFDFGCRMGDPAMVACTGEALFDLDRMRGQTMSPRPRARAAHVLLDAAPPPVRARLWNCIARPVLALPEFPFLASAQQRVLAWREAGDARQLFLALGTLGIAHARVGEWEDSERAFREADGLEDPSWPPRLRIELVGDRLTLGNYRGDAVAYRDSLREMLAFAEQAGALAIAGQSRRSLADAALMLGDAEEAIRLGRAAIADPHTRERARALAVTRSNLHGAHLVAGDLDAAREVGLAALVGCRQTAILHYFFDHLAWYSALTGRVQEAAQLLGFADRVYAAQQEMRQLNEARGAEEAGKVIDAALGTEEHARWRSIGSGLDDTQAVALAESVLAAR